MLPVLRPPSLSCLSLPNPCLVNLNAFFGLALLRFVGCFGLLRTSSLVNTFFLTKPVDNIFKLISILQQWKPLVKACDEKATDVLTSHVHATVNSLPQLDQAPVA